MDFLPSPDPEPVITAWFSGKRFAAVRNGVVLLVLFLSCGELHRACAGALPADRLINWSPGVPGGIPHRTTIWCDVTKSIPGYTGPLANPADNAGFDWEPLQFALAHCPEGQVVYIPAGTYKINGTLCMYKPITVRGDGMGKTIIKVDAPTDIYAFYLLSGNPFIAAPQFAVLAGTDKGSTRFTYGQPIGGDGNPYVEVGVPVIIMNENLPGLVNINGCVWAEDNNPSYAQSQVVVPKLLEGVNVPGHAAVTFSPPLYVDMTNHPKTLRFGGVIKQAGVEDLTVNHVSYHGGGSASIALQTALNCWVKDVEINKSPKSGIKLMDAIGCEIRGCYVHGAWNTEGGSAYGFHIFGFNSAHLIEDNIGENLRHTVVFEGGGNGCVVAYNYSRGAQTSSSPGWVHDDLITHGAHPYLNLFEGNVAHKWIHDWVHGSSSHNTGFRNRLTEGLEPDSEGGGYEDTNGVHHAYTIGYWAAGTGNCNYYISAVGNVLGWPSMTGGPWDYEYTHRAPAWGRSIYKLGYADEGDENQSDPKAASTYYRHGNFDYVTNGVKWDPENSDHKLPNSLYLKNKPAFFKDMHWPPIGPDQTPMVSPLPAQVRWKALKGISTAPPAR